MPRTPPPLDYHEMGQLSVWWMAGELDTEIEIASGNSSSFSQGGQIRVRKRKWTNLSSTGSTLDGQYGREDYTALRVAEYIPAFRNGMSKKLLAASLLAVPPAVQFLRQRKIGDPTRCGARKVDLVLAEKEYVDLGKGPRSHPHSNGSHYLSPLRESHACHIIGERQTLVVGGSMLTRRHYRYDSDAAPYQRSQIVKSTTPPVESNQNPGNSAAQKGSSPGPDPKPVSNGLGIDVSPGMWVAEILGAIIGVVVFIFIVSQLKAYRRANTDQTLETLDFQFQNISRSSPVTNTIPTMESGCGRHPRYQAAYNCVLMQQGEYQAHSAESYACI
ncbi:hypothetical protein PABG_00686 [Paracoccidioides brasiliensis Pb03]|nr:hypothetical protein PABG_00686 [Paracoccidioides brasiliensis Pb03]